MKRRNFVQSLLVVPASAVAAEQAAPPTVTPAPPPQTSAPAIAAPPPTQNIRRPLGAPKFSLVQPDTAAETAQAFFTASQFAALNKLAEIMVPPIKNRPGALDAHAPEFLDFLISRSTSPTQSLYREGLDGVNSSAKKHFHKSFAELDAKQADSIIRPLLVARPWEKEEPKDPMQRFMAQVHDDLRTATRNSAEWAASGGFSSGRRTYWKPVDPRVGA